MLDSSRWFPLVGSLLILETRRRGRRTRGRKKNGKWKDDTLLLISSYCFPHTGPAQSGRPGRTRLVWINSAPANGIILRERFELITEGGFRYAACVLFKYSSVSSLNKLLIWVLKGKWKLIPTLERDSRWSEKYGLKLEIPIGWTARRRLYIWAVDNSDLHQLVHSILTTCIFVWTKGGQADNSSRRE